MRIFLYGVEKSENSCDFVRKYIVSLKTSEDLFLYS